MKKQLLGLSILGVVALGGSVAFASGEGVVENGFARGGLSAEKGTCLVEGENRDKRLEEIALALEGVDRQDLADYLRTGEFTNVREALDGLAQEDQLEVRQAMRESGLNNRKASKDGSGCGLGRQMGRSKK